MWYYSSYEVKRISKFVEIASEKSFIAHACVYDLKSINPTSEINTNISYRPRPFLFGQNCAQGLDYDHRPQTSGLVNNACMVSLQDFNLRVR